MTHHAAFILIASPLFVFFWSAHTLVSKNAPPKKIHTDDNNNKLSPKETPKNTLKAGPGAPIEHKWMESRVEGRAMRRAPPCKLVEITALNKDLGEPHNKGCVWPNQQTSSIFSQTSKVILWGYCTPNQYPHIETHLQHTID